MNHKQFLEMRRKVNEEYLRRKLTEGFMAQGFRWYKAKAMADSWSIEVHGDHAVVVGLGGDFRVVFPARKLLTEAPLRALGLVP